MISALNVPYKKEYDENGVLKNPMGNKYPSLGSMNRRNRRVKPQREMNNRNTFPTIVLYGLRFTKRVQLVYNKNKKRMIRIVHIIDLNKKKNEVSN